ncbi:mRNA cap guanine-N7 methyltransferase [Rhynchospora pubera]|uniref:mRNA cap guanine-N(7) methyltransferase 2 n=1 Tax=Rhynchospora pubera TaxID=906938 RepID=A0AAV8HTZ6_9POAL|nr:mRNA cap guanine-N7 methyltransferase [Rhynchospora pubera]
MGMVGGGGGGGGSSNNNNKSSSASIHSRICEFATAALITIFAFPYAAVCELYSNANDNKRKIIWDDAQIAHFLGIGIRLPNPISAEEEKEDGPEAPPDIWDFPTLNPASTYSADFFHADPCTDDLEPSLQGRNAIPADLLCCFNHLQLCFESEHKARKLLHNVSSLLKPGGYFFGIVPDSSTIWTKYQKNVEALLHKGGGTKSNMAPAYIRSDNYVITFEVEEDKFPSFGKRYQLKFANEATVESHCLVHFPSLIRLAREAGLECIEIQNLTEFYDDNRAQFSGMFSSYAPNLVDPRGKLLPRSFDILGLYSIFVFQKPDPDAVPPLFTPLLADEDPSYDEQEWMGDGVYPQPTSVDEEIRSQMETSTVTTATATASTIAANTEVGEQEKGILGPGPADFRLS